MPEDEHERYAPQPSGVAAREGFFLESLILAQNERWQRGLGMQVERDPGGSNVFR